MRRQWYLVQVNLTATATLHTSHHENGHYYCEFLAKHPEDSDKSDADSRWWPDWYRYSYDSVSNDIVFGDRMLFWPNMCLSLLSCLRCTQSLAVFE